MKKILIILSFLFCLQSYSQTKPKLVVGIVVDQMRFDYIYRFWEDFGDGGFKKLIGEGHFFRNCQFGYLPTYTGPGHASIFTGTTPSVHGIIANDWYDKNTGEYIYSAGDGDMHTICNCEKNNVDIISKDGKIPHRQTDRKVNVRDIAPTISTLLGISYPNGCTGNPLPEVTQ